MTRFATDMLSSRQSTASTRASLRLLLLDVPERQAAALAAVLADASVDLIAREAGSCDARSMAQLGAHVALVPIWRLSLIAPHALAAGVPLVALNLRGQAVDWTRSALRDVAAVTAVDIVSDPAATLETAVRIGARTRLDGSVAIVLPGPADTITAARALAKQLGLRAIACRAIEELSSLVSQTEAVLLIAGAWADAGGLARTAELKAHYGDRLVVASLGRVAYDALEQFDAVVEQLETIPETLLRALDHVRRGRVMAGRHAATNLALPQAMALLATDMFTANAADAPRTVVVVRTNESDLQMQAPWAVETRRLASDARAAFPAAVVGYDDDGSLVLLLPTDAADAERHTVEWAAPRQRASWHAGIADTAETNARDFQFLRSCAREALAMDVSSPIRRWHRDAATNTPEVVIIEPDPLLSQMLQYGLRSMGHSCRALETGSDALDLLRRLPPTARPVLVVTDVELAGLDGHSLHERVRVERPGAFEFVFLTNHAAEGEQLRALEAGARDYLLRPISVRVLLARLQRLLTSR